MNGEEIETEKGDREGVGRSLSDRSVFPLIHHSVIFSILTVILFLVAPVWGDEPSNNNKEFRVCADPNNLPSSNRRQEGFENKIAELLAAEFDSQVTYTWWPQRRGFIRNTLNAGVCDVVMGVPAGSEQVL